MQSQLDVYHAPQTRSSGVMILLEELGAPFTLHTLNMKAGDQRKPAFLAINSMGKVPAIRHNGALVTEQVAVFLYLADLFPDAKLAPALGDPLRGPYLRWMAFYGSCFEPAVTDRSLKREPAPPSMSGYGDFDTMFGTLRQHLSENDHMLGARFSAADILWGTSLTWMTMFKAIPESPEIVAYTKRLGARPSVAKISQQDAELAKQHAAAAEAVHA